MSALDRIPTVKNCCFGISLKTGCIIIGILSLLVSVDTLLGFSIMTAEECSGAILKILAGFDFVFAALLILSSITLLYGITKEDPKLIKWFIYILMGSMVVQIIYGAALIIYMVTGRCWSAFGMLVTILAAATVGIYWVMVVNSYRMERMT